jgi:ribonuclease HI
MEHALLECNAPGHKKIWNLCHDLWEKKFAVIPNTSIGLILGCELIQFKDSKDKNMPEANKLFKIIISESAFLIWKIRCERVMSNKIPTETEIHNRWVAFINKRLKIGQLLTDKSRYGNRALDIKTVLKTRDGVLMDNENLPEQWIWGFRGYR